MSPARFLPDRSGQIVRAVWRSRRGRALVIALSLSVALNAFFVFTPFVDRAYDSQIHLFFAHHYAAGWFNPWETRWFGGMWLFSYPPLTHQLLALLLSVFGSEAAYRILHAIILLSIPIAVGKLAGALLSEEVAAWAVVLSVLVPGVYLSLYLFGQMPQMLGVVAALLGAGFYADYLRTGKRRALVAACLWAGVTAAVHVVAVGLLMGLLLVVMVQHWLKTPRRFPVTAVGHFALFLAVALLVIAPFWWWYFTQSVPQAEIYHASRYAILLQARATRTFVTLIYGPLVVLLVLAVLFSREARRQVPLLAFILFLGLLGLGTRTPLPRLVFAYRETWRWMTYGRFAVWAALLSVIPVGAWLRSVRSGWRWIWVPVAGALLVTCALSAAEVLRRNSHPPLNGQVQAELVAFLGSDEARDWRYMTVDMGVPEVAQISWQADAAYLDGAYYTARRDPYLSQRGIGLPGEFYRVEDVEGTLRYIFDHPQEWNLRWVVARSQRLDGLLSEAGWRPYTTLGDPADWRQTGSLLTIWEAPAGADIPPIPSTVKEPPSYPWILALWWGIVPLSTLAVALAISAWQVLKRWQVSLTSSRW